MNWKIAMDSKIPLRSAKSSQCVPRQVPLPRGITGKVNERIATGRSSRRVHEGRWIQCLSPRILRSVQVERLPSDDIRPNVGEESVRQSAKNPVKDVNRS